MLIKVAPELSWEAYEELIDLCLSKSVSGIVATNTTVERPVSSDSACQKTYAETGGLSGAPLRDRSTAVIRFLVESTQGRLPVIGVGGIMSADDAMRKMDAGASLLQVYSGLVYEGPALIRECVDAHKMRP